VKSDLLDRLKSLKVVQIFKTKEFVKNRTLKVNPQKKQIGELMTLTDLVGNV